MVLVPKGRFKYMKYSEFGRENPELMTTPHGGLARKRLQQLLQEIQAAHRRALEKTGRD